MRTLAAVEAADVDLASIAGLARALVADPADAPECRFYGKTLHTAQQNDPAEA